MGPLSPSLPSTSFPPCPPFLPFLLSLSSPPPSHSSHHSHHSLPSLPLLPPLPPPPPTHTPFSFRTTISHLPCTCTSVVACSYPAGKKACRTMQPRYNGTSIHTSLRSMKTQLYFMPCADECGSV